MPRTIIPNGFQPAESQLSHSREPHALFTLANSAEHKLHVHPISADIVRIVYAPPDKVCAYKNADGIQWEPSPSDATFSVSVGGKPNTHVVQSSRLRLIIEYQPESAPRLSWFSKPHDAESNAINISPGVNPDTPFLQDVQTRAYFCDRVTGSVSHYVERELWLPSSELEASDLSKKGNDDREYESNDRDEYIYGLGETTGSLLKQTTRRYTLDPRDSLGYDPVAGDGGMYKTQPFYLVHKRSLGIWFGVYYNMLVPSVFDIGAETDGLFGSFRSFQAAKGPLDYYVILADGTLPSIISAYAKLVTPQKANQSHWAASPTLPPLSQFGYLASSLGLAALSDAQEAILQFVKKCREKGFPVDGLHLSSGWCQDEKTGVRNVFEWNRVRYPDPAALGASLEGPPNGVSSGHISVSTEALRSNAPAHTAGVKLIVNVKPWLLDQHPKRANIPKRAFVRSATTSEQPGNAETSILWARGLGEHARGSYLDFSSKMGIEWWADHLSKTLLANSLTGVWIDNNEFSGLLDDEADFCGEVGFWEPIGTSGNETKDLISRRMGWGRGRATVGQVGRVSQVMGMAKATYEALIAHAPSVRPVIVSRSGVPGIQAYSHGSWSGDNVTTWASLRLSTAMTLSNGISFGTGLYGHDIGGFAPSGVSPSPELLIRWCQHGAWHTRFVVHSWKDVDTTLWMYQGVMLEGRDVCDILLEIVGWRYRLAPTLYSLYIDHFHRRGWPVLKPTLWYHSEDRQTLGLDEQFIVGSHVLVAPVVRLGERTKSVYLPSHVIGSDRQSTWWCELDTGIWHKSVHGSQEVRRNILLDARIDQTPVLVRAGGILVLGGNCTTTVYDGKRARTALIFPPPPEAAISGDDTIRGQFHLIEDDGTSNSHTNSQVYTELVLSFRLIGDNVEVGYDIVHDGYSLPFRSIEVRLPIGDERQMIARSGNKLVKDKGAFHLLM